MTAPRFRRLRATTTIGSAPQWRNRWHNPADLPLLLLARRHPRSLTTTRATVSWCIPARAAGLSPAFRIPSGGGLWRPPFAAHRRFPARHNPRATVQFDDAVFGHPGIQSGARRRRHHRAAAVLLPAGGGRGRCGMGVDDVRNATCSGRTPCKSPFAGACQGGIPQNAASAIAARTTIAIRLLGPVCRICRLSTTAGRRLAQTRALFGYGAARASVTANRLSAIARGCLVAGRFRAYQSATDERRRGVAGVRLGVGTVSRYGRPRNQPKTISTRISTCDNGWPGLAVAENDGQSGLNENSRKQQKITGEASTFSRCTARVKPLTLQPSKCMDCSPSAAPTGLRRRRSFRCRCAPADCPTWLIAIVRYRARLPWRQTVCVPPFQRSSLADRVVDLQLYSTEHDGENDVISDAWDSTRLKSQLPITVDWSNMKLRRSHPCSSLRMRNAALPIRRPNRRFALVAMR